MPLSIKTNKLILWTSIPSASKERKPLIRMRKAKWNGRWPTCREQKPGLGLGLAWAWAPLAHGDPGRSAKQWGNLFAIPLLLPATLTKRPSSPHIFHGTVIL